MTKGPSLVANNKRLAVQTEDHPMQYLEFEGNIPKGEYGGGTMIVWDRGRWSPEGDPHFGLNKGHLAFSLEGTRLRGRWHLVRTLQTCRKVARSASDRPYCPVRGHASVGQPATSAFGTKPECGNPPAMCAMR